MPALPEPGDRPRRAIRRVLTLLAMVCALVAACRPAHPPATTVRTVQAVSTSAPVLPVPGACANDDLAVPVTRSAILREVNLARARPGAYADYLETWLPLLRGTRLERPGRNPWALHEGRPAIEDAIRFLRTAPPQGPLVLSDGMSLGAADLARDQGPRGEKGHVGSDGRRVADRLRRYGSWTRKAAEVVQYGAVSPREIVALLLVDDGVPDRGHRLALFDGDYRVTGVAFGPHAHYRTMCVITLAAGYEDALGMPAPSGTNGPAASAVVGDPVDHAGEVIGDEQ